MSNITEIIYKHVSDCFPSEAFLESLKNINPSNAFNLKSIIPSDISQFMSIYDKANLEDGFHLLCSIDGYNFNVYPYFWIQRELARPLFQEFLLTYWRFQCLQLQKRELFLK